MIQITAIQLRFLQIALNGGGFLKNCAMATVFIVYFRSFKAFFLNFPILGACASNEMEYTWRNTNSTKHSD